MTASTGTHDEYQFFITSVKKWLDEVRPFQETTVGSIVPRFIRDANTFITDVQSLPSPTTSDLIDLADRFYVLEAIKMKIVDDRF